MEQKRTLWILVSAGIFLCFVFGTAFIVSNATSKKNKSSVAKDSSAIWVAPYESTPVTSSEPVISTGLNPHVETASNDSAADPEPSATSSLDAALDHPAEGVTTAVVPETDSSKSDSSARVADASSETSKPATTTFNLSETSSTSVSNVTAQNKAAETAMKNTEAAHQKNVVAKTLDESTQKKSSASVAKAETPKKSTAPKAASSAPKAQSSSQTLPDRYWVQAASYSSKKKADEARALLDENKIQCEVFTYDASGTLYYRVRVGPYLNKDEAEYWKKQVDAIELFANAGTYIVNSSAPIAKN